MEKTMRKLSMPSCMYGKLLGTLFCTVFLTFGIRMTVEAVEFTTTDMAEVLYTTDQTSFYTEPDAAAAPVSTVAAGIPVQVTGVTSNGWYRIAAGGVFYTPGNQLVRADGAGQNMADLQTGPAVPKQATPRMERIEAVVSGTEEAVALTKQGIEAHATSLVFQGDAGTYQAIVKTVSEQLYAPLQNYEEATIKGLAVKQRGRNCTAEIRRVSTIEEENAVDAAVAELVPQFNQGSTSDRVIAVHDFICNTVTYSNETAAGAADYKSAYDALASGQGVCTSYALLFQKFMDQMGIPCYIAVGNRNGVGHAWNIVQVDGQWYHMDCTWDDQSYGIIRKWCLAGSGDAGYASWGGVEIARERYR